MNRKSGTVDEIAVDDVLISAATDWNLVDNDGVIDLQPVLPMMRTAADGLHGVKG